MAHPDHGEQFVLGSVHPRRTVDVEVVAVIEIAVEGPTNRIGSDI